MISLRDVFIREKRRQLLDYLFLPWRRRGASLLHIGLGSGLHPDFFWEAGFEVDALDEDKARLERMRRDSSPKVDFFLSNLEHQPFDDGQYDYAVVAHCLEGRAEVLAEALRVARLGVIVLEWNRFSAASLGAQDSLRREWPWALWFMARRECPGCRIHFLSIVPLPPFTWPPDRPLAHDQVDSVRLAGRTPFRQLHNVVTSLPIGALLGMRIEKEPILRTPLGAVTEALRAATRKGERMAEAAPIPWENSD